MQRKNMPENLTAAEILAHDDQEIEPIDLPEWNGKAFVRVMSGTDRDRLERAIDQKTASRAMIAAYTLCDAKGNRLFTDNDLPALAQKSSVALDRVVDVALRLSRIGPEQEKALAGNLNGDPSADSGSSLHEPFSGAAFAKRKSA